MTIRYSTSSKSASNVTSDKWLPWYKVQLSIRLHSETTQTYPDVHLEWLIDFRSNHQLRFPTYAHPYNSVTNTNPNINIKIKPYIYFDVCKSGPGYLDSKKIQCVNLIAN